ncbi:MAG: DUF3341 domain-containing protein [Candidatus Abyssubacteria bacterium]
MKNNSHTLLAVFSGPHQLYEGIRAAKRYGVHVSNMEALSPAPLPELDELMVERPSVVRWVTLLGCVTGGLFGLWLQIATALDWPLRVGGKPVVSLPAFVVIAFELTILFGAVGTLAGLFMAAKLPPISKTVFHEGCSQSEFGLLVRHTPSEYAALEGLLREAGARDVRIAHPRSTVLD